jgi:hypothetical protein
MPPRKQNPYLLMLVERTKNRSGFYDDLIKLDRKTLAMKLGWRPLKDAAEAAEAEANQGQTKH